MKMQEYSLEEIKRIVQIDIKIQPLGTERWLRD